MSGDDQTRVGTAEREKALSSLADHFAAGRLDADEYEDRRGKAGDAVVQRDLVALFTDLPGGAASSTNVVAEQPRESNRVAQPPMNRDDRRAQGRQDRAQGYTRPRNKWQGVVALAPFVALALFFTTDHWQWFLLVPVAGIVYGIIVNDN